jgi:nitrite reductase/ring-hydroxylating ferredoxin subunit
MMEPTAAAYTQGDAFQAEKRALFGTAWLPLCHVAQIPGPGDFIAHAIGGWPLFALRGADDVVRAMRNACRHQGMQLADTPGGHCSEVMRCRFHGWTYDLAGRFVAAPDPVAPADTTPGVNDLPRVRSVMAAGFLCCTLGAGAGADPTAEFGAALPASGAAYAGTVTSEIGCNWKTYLEHRLADPAARYVWPVLVVQPQAGGVVAEQVIPRTFLRTRIVLHALGADARALQPVADSIASACKALQEQRAAGSMPELTGRVGALWERLGATLGAA